MDAEACTESGSYRTRFSHLQPTRSSAHEMAAEHLSGARPDDLLIFDRAYRLNKADGLGDYVYDFQAK
jgi:hypothetical protein